jgi:tetratricopeptide (TPR) repeat protein
LIHELTGRSLLPAETQSALLERAEGNPLYAEQFVRMLEEQEDEVALPETVQGIIAARLDGLPRAEKELLQDASMVGKVFWTGALEASGGIEPRRAEELLHLLDRKEFVRRERRPSLAGESEYVFRHVLVRDVAYAQIPRSAKSEKHRRVAEWISSLGRPEDHAEMLAHHYTSALELARATGVDTTSLVDPTRMALTAAGERARKLNNNANALQYFGQALGLDPRAHERLDLVFAHAEATYGAAIGDFPTVLGAASDELLEAGDSARAAELQALLVEAWWYRGDHERASGHAERALELVGEADSPSRARVVLHVARLRTLEGTNDTAALELAREALRLAEKFALEEVRYLALNYVGVGRWRTGDPGGAADVEKSLALARSAGAFEAAARAANNLGAQAGYYGYLRQSAEMLEESIRLAERGGHSHSLRWGLALRNMVFFNGGQWDEALRGANEVISESQGREARELPARAIRLQIRFARGDDSGAIEDADYYLDLARAHGTVEALSWALSSRARLAGEFSDVALAQRLTDELLALGVSDLGLFALYQVLLVSERIGRRAELAARLESASADSLWLRACRHLVGESFLEAADVFAEMEHPVHEAQARLLAAEALVERRDSRGADEQLNHALTIFRSVRATRYVREAEALLAAAS